MTGNPRNQELEPALRLECRVMLLIDREDVLDMQVPGAVAGITGANFLDGYPANHAQREMTERELTLYEKMREREHPRAEEVGSRIRKRTALIFGEPAEG